MPYPDFICEPVPLPTPPEMLIAEMLDSLATGALPRIERQAKLNGTQNGVTMRRMIDFQGHRAESRYALKYHVTPDLEHWIRATVPSGYHEISVAHSDGSHIHAPHIDVNRHYVLIMPVVVNDAAVNSWWQKKGYDVEFAKDSWPSVIADYSDVDLVNQVRLKANSWYIFNTYMYHSVENCDGPRIALHVDYNQWDRRNSNCV